MRANVFILCVMVCCVGLASCESVEERPVTKDVQPDAQPVGKKSGDFAIALGWIDGDTFRAKSTAATKDGAISAAQNTVIEKFITERVKASDKIIDVKSTGVAIVNEFGGLVKAGSVIREKQEENMVTIVYEVKSDNLKNRVLGRK